MTNVPSRPVGRLPAYLPIAGSLAIAIGLIAVSYGHIFSFALQAGAQPWEAAILAATVDGAIVAALAVIGLAKARGQDPPKIAKITLVVAVVATGGANLDHGLDHGWRGVAAAVWVPLVAELAYLLAMATHRIDATSDMPEELCPVSEGRPVICGRAVSVATLLGTLPTSEEGARPVICGGHLVSVSEVLAHTPVPAPLVATRPDTVSDRLDTGAREDAVMDWLTDPATTATVDTAKGADITALLAESGHGRVSERTGRRILATVRAAMADTPTAV